MTEDELLRGLLFDGEQIRAKLFHEVFVTFATEKWLTAADWQGVSFRPIDISGSVDPDAILADFREIKKYRGTRVDSAARVCMHVS